MVSCLNLVSVSLLVLFLSAAFVGCGGSSAPMVSQKSNSLASLSQIQGSWEFDSAYHILPVANDEHQLIAAYEPTAADQLNDLLSAGSSPSQVLVDHRSFKVNSREFTVRFAFSTSLTLEERVAHLDHFHTHTTSLAFKVDSSVLPANSTNSSAAPAAPSVPIAPSRERMVIMGSVSKMKKFVPQLESYATDHNYTPSSGALWKDAQVALVYYKITE